MRILQAIESADGGSARHVVDLCGELARRGHDVVLVYSPRRAASWFLTAAVELEALGVALRTVDMHRAPHPSDLAAWRAFRRILTADGPFDVAHGHSSKAGALIRLAAPRGLRTLYTPHGFAFMDRTGSGARRALYTAVERVLAPAASAIVTVSEEERASAVAHGQPANRLEVVPNGVSPPPPERRTDLRARLGLPEAATVVGFVGRMTPEKNPLLAIDAIAAAAAERPSLHGTLLGDGPLSDAADARIAASRASGRIRRHEGLSGLRFMPAFDMLLIPSTNEGGPYVLYEALVSGVPVLMTAVGGSGLLARGGGGLVLDGTTEAFAEAIGRLADDPATRRALAEAAAEMGPIYTVAGMTNRLMTLYRRA